MPAPPSRGRGKGRAGAAAGGFGCGQRRWLQRRAKGCAVGARLRPEGASRAANSGARLGGPGRAGRGTSRARDERWHVLSERS